MAERFIAAQGDSWFDYPGADVLSVLEERHGYRVASCAHRGETLESMAYDPAQGRKLARLFGDDMPDAVLISGGGNDIAGDELAVILNHASSGLTAINEPVLEGVMTRLACAFRSLCFGVSGLSRVTYGREIPIVLHGYGYPIPDGRGYMGGASVLPGPWLRPSLVSKGHGAIEDGTRIMRTLIDAFAEMLRAVASSPGLEHVHVLDLRSTLVASGQYRNLWADELHPTPAGFTTVAEAFHDEVTRWARA